MKYITRHIEKQILEASKYFKAVLLLGARQVGKSTLFTHIFPQIKSIVFEPIQDLYNARKDPELFLNSFKTPLILDEVQYVPELLATLKTKMDKSEAKGQYFLTGSQNFAMLKTISESMAGRIAIFHLDNLTPQETLGLGREEVWLNKYLNDSKNFYKDCKLSSTSQSLVEFLFRGTMPGTIELPTSQIPTYFRSYLQTYIDRDVRIHEDIRQLAEFDRFLGILSSLTAQEINFSQLGREIGISPSTSRRWLDLLMYTYQWIEVLPFYGNTIKRIAGKKKGYFKDTGFASYLQKIDSPESLIVNPKLGSIFETWVVNWIYQQFATMSTPPNTYHWRTAGGAEVDLILEKNAKLYPIEIKCKTNITKADLSGINAFRKTYAKHNLQTGLIIYAGSEIYFVDENTIAIPWTIL